MKKIISICLSISLLCACGGMRGLQRQSTQDLNKTIKMDNEIYYNAKEGHSSNVKMLVEEVQDEYHVQVKIPVSYTEEIKDLDKIHSVPSLKNEDLSKFYNKIGECQNCTIDKDYLTIDIYKGTGSVGSCIANIVLTPVGFLMALAGECSTKWYSFRDLGHAYRHNCSDGSLQIPGKIKISEPANISKFVDKGVISATFETLPQIMHISCDKKSCAVVDENGRFVNKVFIHKKVEANQTGIDNLIIKEKKEAAKRKAEEEKRKAEEAKLKAEQERRWRQMERLRKKECPGLYRTLYWAQQTGYIDPIIGMKTAQRFDELDCGFWLNQQMGY